MGQGISTRLPAHSLAVKQLNNVGSNSVGRIATCTEMPELANVTDISLGNERYKCDIRITTEQYLELVGEFNASRQYVPDLCVRQGRA